MAKFVFPLETVLRHRERLEHDCQREVAVAAAAKVQAQNEIRNLDEAVRNALADLRTNHLIGKINLSFLAAHRRFMMVMQRQGLVLIEKLQERQKQLAIAQASLVEAMKQRKMIEKLRERQEQRWREALTRKESAAADELATQMSFAAGLVEEAGGGPG